MIAYTHETGTSWSDGTLVISKWDGTQWTEIKTFSQQSRQDEDAYAKNDR